MEFNSIRQIRCHSHHLFINNTNPEPPQTKIKEHLTNTNGLNNLSSSQCHPELVSESGLEILNQY
jgi:hypothetical protein